MDRRTVYKCDKLSMEVLEVYTSASEADAAHGLPCGAVDSQCRKRRVGRTGYVFRFADDYDPNETFEGKYNRPVAVKDCITKAVAFFPTLTEAREELGFTRSAISSSMSREYLLHGRYVAMYAR